MMCFIIGKKLDDGVAINGRGRLTNNRIDAMQSFYGNAIRDNKGSAKAMSKATHAILKHYSSTPENPRHEDCPTGKDSWCSYNRDAATGENTHVPIQDPFLEVLVKIIQPIFDRLGSEEFLVGCEKCLDRNRNESLHHVCWGMAPKEQYNSQQESSLAVSLGVLVLNKGLASTVKKLVELLKGCITPETLEDLMEIDRKRMVSSDYKTDPVVKKRRKKRRREKSEKQDGCVHKEGVTYRSQSFYDRTT